MTHLHVRPCAFFQVLCDIADFSESRLWTVTDKLYRSPYKQKAVVWLRFVYRHVLCFIILEVKMPCTVYIKPRQFKGVYVNRVIVLVLVIKAWKRVGSVFRYITSLWLWILLCKVTLDDHVHAVGQILKILIFTSQNLKLLWLTEADTSVRKMKRWLKVFKYLLYSIKRTMQWCWKESQSCICMYWSMTLRLN